MNIVLDSDFSATTVTSDSDTADAEMEFADVIVKGNSGSNSIPDITSSNHRKSRNNDYLSVLQLELRSNRSDQLYGPTPAKILRLASQSKRIMCAKLVKRSKRIKLASMFRSGTVKAPEEMDRTSRDGHLFKCGVSNNKILNEKLERPSSGKESTENEVQVVEILPMNYSTDGQAPTDNHKMPPEETWLPTIMSYWLNKELDEATQFNDAENVKLAKHLKRTLAYFEEKMKDNNHGLHLNEIQNNVVMKTEKVFDAPNIILSSERLLNLTRTVPDLNEPMRVAPCAPPAHQQSRSPPPAHQNSSKAVVRDTPSPAHQRTASNHIISSTLKPKKILASCLSYEHRMVRLDDQLLADDRPLDYCTRENGNTAINLNAELGNCSDDRPLTSTSSMLTDRMVKKENKRDQGKDSVSDYVLDD